MWLGRRLEPSTLLPLIILINAVYSVESRILKDKLPGYPVILIPGEFGSQLKANLTGKPSTVHYACSKITSDFFDLWLDLRSFAPILIDCWVDNVKLVFDNVTKTTSDMPGVDVRVSDFGNTSSVEWLDNSKASQGRYFYDLVEALVSWGYRRDKHVAAAPYDWRKAPNEQSSYYMQLKVLTEALYYWNGNRKVVFIAHSTGNLMLKFFLDHVIDARWKSKFVRSFISIAAPWGGSARAVKRFASGTNMNNFRILLPSSSLREMQRSFTSSALQFPNQAAWNPDDILAVDRKINKTYTVANIREFFSDIGYEIGWEHYKVAGPPSLGGFDAPDVETHCIYGRDVETPERFEWDSGYFPDYPPNNVMGDGDGTVNRRSTEVCLKWRDAEEKKTNSNDKKVKITPYDIKGAEHMDILKHPAMLERVRQVLNDEV